MPQITLCCVRLAAYLRKPTACETLPFQTPNPIIQEDGADSTTLFPLTVQTPQPLPSILLRDGRTESVHSSSCSNDMVKQLLCCVCVRARVVFLPVSVIRYIVFIKWCSLPALSSQCFFVPARPVSGVTHIIAP